MLESRLLYVLELLECATVGSVTRVFVTEGDPSCAFTSEDGHHVIVLPSGRWLNLDRATGHLFFEMTYSFMDQVLVQLDLLRKLMMCLTNSGLHVGWCHARSRTDSASIEL